MLYQCISFIIDLECRRCSNSQLVQEVHVPYPQILATINELKPEVRGNEVLMCSLWFGKGNPGPRTCSECQPWHPQRRKDGATGGSSASPGSDGGGGASTWVFGPGLLRKLHHRAAHAAVPGSTERQTRYPAPGAPPTDGTHTHITPHSQQTHGAGARGTRPVVRRRPRETTCVRQ